MKVVASTWRPLAKSLAVIAGLTILFGLPLPSGTSVSASPKKRGDKPSIRKSQALRTKSTKRSNRKKARDLKIAESVTGAGEDEVEGRRDWFMFQRTYPFGVVPAAARRLAWVARPPRPKPVLATESANATVWSPIGPMPTRAYGPLFDNFGYNSGRINTIAVSPTNPQIILVGGSTGGIWRSTDGGANFSPVSDAQVDLAVGAIAFSPSNSAIVYAGMGDMHSCCDYLGSGVLKSTDAGATWVRINNGTLPQPASVGDLEVDPNNPNKIYLALYRSLDNSNANSFPYGGVYVSTDGGVNWVRKFAGLPRDLAINTGNPQIVYAAMRGVGTSGNGGIGGLYRSLNGGDTWNVVYAAPYGEAFVSGGLRDVRVAVSAANAQRVYVYSGNGSSGSSTIRLAVSDDGGATFPTDTVLTTVDKGQFGYNTYLAADPLDANTVFIGARDVFRSTNSGVNWTNLTRTFNASFSYSPQQGKAHPDQHAIAFTGGAGVFFIGNDGGIYKTSDNGANFQSLNNTLSLTQFVSIARHPTNVSMVYGGTQDNGTQRRIGPTEWEDIASGDGGNLVINPVNPSTFFVTYVNGVVWRLDNDGTSGTNTIATGSTFKNAGGTNERVAFYPPLVGNGVTSQIYIGTQRVWTTTDLGGSWNPTGDTPDLTRGSPDVLSAIGVAKSNPNVIYTGSEQGRVMVSTDGGQNWTEVTTGLPNRFVTSIKVDYNNPATAYLTVSGFGSGHVFKTTNTGANWTDVSGVIGSGGLPNIPVNTLHIDLANPNLIYAGSDIGVFRSTTGGNSWASFSDGMPPVIVTAISANNTGAIYAATYGRGAYEATITSAASVSGRVLDGFGNGVAGATVNFSGSQTGATTTDGNGNYLLPALAIGGNYTLSPSKPGQFSSFARVLNNLAGDTTSFDLQLSPFVVVNIHTADSANNNLSGVAVTQSGQQSAPITNAAGNLNLNLSAPVVGGTQYTLTPIKLGYAFNPLTFSFNTQAGNQLVTFTAIPPNSIDAAGTFVRQQYLDFLDREPDQGGFDYWSARITECGADQLCIHHRRIDTSAAFFVEAEFQRTGSFVYRLYKGSLGRRPTFTEFTQDRAHVIEGPTLEQTKQSLTLAFVQRVEFVNKYNGQNTDVAFVDALIATVQQSSGVDLNPIKPTLMTEYNSGGNANECRARAVRAAIDNVDFTTAEYNPSFVLMQYFGYLRRDPDPGGYDFWLNILNNREPNNFRGMVCAFITSTEYQQRFGASVTRTNRDCGN
jgi:photosystem II stability/assembly factor-like uncharacterized protein